MKNIMLLSLFLSFVVTANDTDHSHQLLVKSLERFNENKFDSAAEIQGVSSWLAELPTVQLSLLQSDNNWGTDEYEFSLNIPFKSRARRNLDDQLLQTTQAFKSVLDQQRALFVSGLIRETIWNYKIAQKKQAVEQSKLDWLNKQRSLLAELQQSGNSNLDLLLVENQIIEAQLLILVYKQDAQARLTQFKNLTGENSIPESFFENVISDQQTLLRMHPSVQQLQLAIEQSSIKYQLAGKARQPINVALSALEIDTNGADDRQYGVAVELPIGLGKSTSQVDQSTWQQEQNDLSNQLMNFEQLFSTEWAQLNNQHQFLIKKQQLLQQQATKTKQIFLQLNLLRNSNELNRDLYYQRMVGLISSGNQAELNQIYIYQNQSRQQQLAGVSL